ncbi:broad-complex core protein isoforms 1/2/3/4/5 isoform X2 [Anopheles gambiae]|uniref:broad-complex core protein isoforms 1/2/3/4/5 isoform X2 n=1 Tax=Anopheles gambiae TaxID=7165 RepID=UPI002AC8D592|nr:broad-complex core protein isoforms 1/2/3/4/5 isoform X2 [Anopheles gambiae]
MLFTVPKRRVLIGKTSLLKRTRAASPGKCRLPSLVTCNRQGHTPVLNSAIRARCGGDYATCTTRIVPPNMSQAAAGLSQQFCVRWNSHLGSLGAAFPQLLAGQRFVDVTLACEGHQVHCHRLVLAACSTYFENLLGENPCKHPIIILPRDIKLWAIQALVDFMYKGEVNVSQAGLPDLMKCAEVLKIRGLCGSDAALNLNQVHSPSGSHQYQQQQHSSANSSDAGEPVEHAGATARASEGSYAGRHGGQSQSARMQQSNASSGPKRQLLNSLNLQPIDAGIALPHHHHHQQNEDGVHSDNGESGNEMCIKTEDLIIDEDDSGSRQCGDEEELGMDSTDKTGSDAIRCEQFLGAHPMDAEDRVGSDSMREDRMEEEMEVSEKMIDDGRMVMEKSEQCHTDRHPPSSGVGDPPDYDHFEANEIEGAEPDLMELSGETDAPAEAGANRKRRKLATTTTSSTLNSELLVSAGGSSSSTTLSSYSHSANSAGEQRSKAGGGPRTVGAVPSLSSIGVRSGPGGSRGSIRVKSIENLFENYQAKQSPKSSRDKRRAQPHHSPVVVLGCSGANISENDSSASEQQQHAASLMYNRNEMDVYVKQQQQRILKTAAERHADGGDETNASTVMSDGDGYENIICSPNFPQLSEAAGAGDGGAGAYKAEEDDEDEEYGDEYAIQLLAEEIDSSLLANGGGESEGDEILYKPPALMALGAAKGAHPGRTAAGLRAYGAGGPPTSTLTIRKLDGRSRGNVPQATGGLARTVTRRPRLTGRSKDALHQLLNSNGTPPPVAFTLRNPRGNQPRTYNTEALWAALMDVKAGESIYRASQMHKVPRKTLRNWMKRWDIKSAYPMPRQLKEAAEKKRIIKELTSQIQ